MKQISAYISEDVNERIEEYSKTHGIKKAFLIEEALLHHLTAVEELPQDLIIPPMIKVTRASGERILKRLRHPSKPTKPMIELMKS
jgi:hypothetical protein